MEVDFTKLTRFIWKVRHFNLFPRPVGEIVEKHSLQELHVSLTQGLWRSHKWGYPVRFAGPGAEVSALFQPHLSLWVLLFLYYMVHFMNLFLPPINLLLNEVQHSGAEITVLTEMIVFGW